MYQQRGWTSRDARAAGYCGCSIDNGERCLPLSLPLDLFVTGSSIAFTQHAADHEEEESTPSFLSYRRRRSIRYSSAACPSQKSEYRAMITFS